MGVGAQGLGGGGGPGPGEARGPGGGGGRGGGGVAMGDACASPIFGAGKGPLALLSLVHQAGVWLSCAHPWSQEGNSLSRGE